MSFAKFEKLANNRFKFGWFMLIKLPSAWLCGVRLRHLDASRAQASVPYKWLSQNPFNSIYFACLAMAAELSTGALGLAYLYQRQPSVSMLVVGIHMKFLKKANSRIVFTCDDGALFDDIIKQAVATGEPQTLVAHSVGTTASGEVVCEFSVEWSFRARK